MKTPRLIGIELVRILSSFAVILVHSGDDTWNLPIAASAVQFRLFFYFGVPFFLAISFYFLTAKTESVYKQKFWLGKIERLLAPYAIWSVIFLVFRLAMFTATQQTERVQQLISDPLAVVFFGGASYQLYFLPLLFTGTFLVLLAPLLAKFNVSNFITIFIATLAVISYTLLETSGNSFHLGNFDAAFQSMTTALNIDLHQHPVLRLVLVLIAWTIRCLPYFWIALIFHKLRVVDKVSQAAPTKVIGLGIFCLAANTLGKTFLPAGLSDVLLAFLLLLFSIAISSYLKNDRINRIVANAGTCSFGIYLIHPFVMSIVKPVIGKLFPIVINSVSILSISTLSISCFLISWVLVAGLIGYKNKSLGKYLFGVSPQL